MLLLGIFLELTWPIFGLVAVPQTTLLVKMTVLSVVALCRLVEVNRISENDVTDNGASKRL
jgi:hypothetical protein